VDGKHDLVQLIQQATDGMAAEYGRIRMRAKEDPGTAGDQGEQNWAELLSNWLPTSFHVVTKGRIVFSSGQASGQLDVLVLNPSYPRGLLDKKLYLAAGVLAAFECKNTLRREHIRKSVKSSAILGSLSRSDRSMKQHIFYGLLAHSHEVAFKKRPSREVVRDALAQADQAEIDDPRDCLDFICVADLGTWTLMRIPLVPASESNAAVLLTSYMGPLTDAPNHAAVHGQRSDAIGRFLTSLLSRFGLTDPALASIGSYFYDTGLFGMGEAISRRWDLDDLSEGLEQMIII
jgi:hypothetical protein